MAAKTAWGIEIGNASLKAVKLVRDGTDVQVAAFEVIDYPVFPDNEEEEKDNAIRDALNQLLMHHDIQPSDSLALSIPGKAVFSKFIKLPPVEKKRIPEIVKYESRQQIPFPIDEVIWDYQPLEEEFPPGEEIEVGIFAVKREVVYTHLSLLESYGLKPDLIQAAPLAMYNYVAYDQATPEALVLVDVGAESTELLVIDGSRYWPRSLTTAGNAITRSLQQKFQIPFVEAEKLKRAAGTSKQAEKLMGVMRTVLRSLVGEVQRSLGFYKSQHDSVKIDRVLITGQGFQLAGLQNFFEQTLKYPVQRLGRPGQIPISPEAGLDKVQKEIHRFGIPLGLALQGLGLGRMRVSLMPPEYVQAKRAARKKPFVSAAAAVFLIATAVSYMLGVSEGSADPRGDDYIGTIQQRTAELNQAKEAWKPVGDLLQQISGLTKDRETALPRELPLLVLAEVTEAMVPDDMWLIRLHSQRIPNPEREKTGGPSHFVHYTVYGSTRGEADPTKSLEKVQRRLLDPLSRVDMFEMDDHQFVRKYLKVEPLPPEYLREKFWPKEIWPEGAEYRKPIGIWHGDSSRPIKLGGMRQPGTESAGEGKPDEKGYYFKISWLIKPDLGLAAAAPEE